MTSQALTLGCVSSTRESVKGRSKIIYARSLYHKMCSVTKPLSTILLLRAGFHPILPNEFFAAIFVVG
jgi:hypothetical protein